MANEFPCTKCGRQLHPGNAPPGRRVLCPGCGAFSEVPEPGAGSASQPGPAPPAGAPIEFRCTQCNKLLRTPAETAGKQAKCPECGAILPVPMAGVAATSAGGPRVPPPPPPPTAPAGSPFGAGGEENPYASPTAQAAAGPSYTYVPSGEIRHTIIDLGDVFSRTWAIFTDQFAMCLAAALIVAVINLVTQGGLHVLQKAAEHDLGIALVYLVVSVAASMFLMWLNIGQTLFFLKIARGEEPDLAALFAGGPFFLRILGASILVGLMTTAGVLLCIVPGVILALMFSQFFLLILDQNLGVMDSLNTSNEITKGNKVTLLVIGLVVGILGTVFAVFTCGLGIIAVIPFGALLSTVIYLMMTGQRTADQLRAGSPMA